MRKSLIAFAVAQMIAAPAWAQSAEPPPIEEYLDPEKREQAERLVEEGLRNMLDAMSLFLLSIPQYESPEVTPEGDIIIRRRRDPIDPLEEFHTPGESET